MQHYLLIMQFYSFVLIFSQLVQFTHQQCILKLIFRGNTFVLKTYSSEAKKVLHYVVFLLRKHELRPWPSFQCGSGSASKLNEAVALMTI